MQSAICPVVKATDAENCSSPVFAVFKTGGGKKGQVKVSVTTDTGHIQGSPAVTTVDDVLQFDPDGCHTGLVLSNYGRTVKYHGEHLEAMAVYSTARWSMGKHEISVRLDKFGPAPYPGYSNYAQGMCNEKEPGLTCWYGNLAWISHDTSYGTLGQPWRSGDVITCHWIATITRQSLAMSVPEQWTQRATLPARFVYTSRRVVPKIKLLFCKLDVRSYVLPLEHLLTLLTWTVGI